MCESSEKTEKISCSTIIDMKKITDTIRDCKMVVPKTFRVIEGFWQALWVGMGMKNYDNHI